MTMNPETDRMGIDASHWVLPSTEGSKYAHAPNWSVHGFDYPGDRPACDLHMPNWENRIDQQGLAEGKPPCPKCVRRLRHHVRWLTEWLESYENLTWEDGRTHE